MNAPTQPDSQYTLDQLTTLAGVPRRTVRYYIQLGLVDRPVGETRAAYYTWQHLKQLLEVRGYTEQGFSLERIRELQRRGSEPPADLGAPRAGHLTVQSHIHLADGIELVIEPGRAGMTPEQLRHFARAALAAYVRAVADTNNKET
jgi:DNA-binding transcriptional MerR regulator